MQKTKRAYATVPATWVLLAFTLAIYHDLTATHNGQENLQMWRGAICETLGITTQTPRFGCVTDGMVQTEIQTAMWHHTTPSPP